MPRQKDKGKKDNDEPSDYEKARAATMSRDADVLAKLDLLTVGKLARAHPSLCVPRRAHA